MTISKQTTRLLAVIEALDNIKEVNGFQTTVLKVLRGVRSVEDFSGELPGLTVYKPLNENSMNVYGGTGSEMSINIWGFTKVEARVNDYSALDKLAADVELLLMSREYNVYLTETFIKSTSFYEGGVQDSFGFFNMQVVMRFDHELTDI